MVTFSTAAVSILACMNLDGKITAKTLLGTSKILGGKTFENRIVNFCLQDTNWNLDGEILDHRSVDFSLQEIKRKYRGKNIAENQQNLEGYFFPCNIQIWEMKLSTTKMSTCCLQDL